MYVAMEPGKNAMHRAARETGEPMALVLSRGYYHVVPLRSWKRAHGRHEGYAARRVAVSGSSEANRAAGRKRPLSRARKNVLARARRRAGR